MPTRGQKEAGTLVNGIRRNNEKKEVINGKYAWPTSQFCQDKPLSYQKNHLSLWEQIHIWKIFNKIAFL